MYCEFINNKAINFCSTKYLLHRQFCVYISNYSEAINQLYHIVYEYEVGNP